MTKIITSKELENLTNYRFIDKIRALKIEQALFISHKEWPHKSEVPIYVRSLDFESGRKYKINKVKDGYTVLRKE